MILRRLQAIDDARVHVATIENLLRLVQELIQGESGGLSQLDVDLLNEALVRGRRGFSREVVALRDALDELKVELGLSPHAAVIPDRRNLAGFRDTWKAVDVWARRPDRSLAELPRIVEHLPTLGDAIVGGQPILRAIEQAPPRMEDLLKDAARLAIKNRGVNKAQPTGDRDAALELRVRRRVRHLLELHRDYADQKRGYVLAVRLRDQAFERLVSSSSGAGNIPRTPVIQGLVNDVGAAPRGRGPAGRDLGVVPDRAAGVLSRPGRAALRELGRVLRRPLGRTRRGRTGPGGRARDPGVTPGRARRTAATAPRAADTAGASFPAVSEDDGQDAHVVASQNDEDLR